MRREASHKKRGSLKRCLRASLILSLSLAGALRAQQQVSAPASTQVSSGGQRVEPTLQQLYQVFLRFALHIEERSNSDEQLGIDRTFYRKQLQIASGLNPDEYTL